MSDDQTVDEGDSSESAEQITIENIYPNTVNSIREILSNVDGFSIGENDNLKSLSLFLVSKFNENSNAFTQLQGGLAFHELFNMLQRIPIDYLLVEDDTHVKQFLGVMLPSAIRESKSIINFFKKSVNILNNSDGTVPISKIFDTLSFTYIDPSHESKNNKYIKIVNENDFEIPSKYFLIVRTLLDNARSAGSTLINVSVENNSIQIFDNAVNHSFIGRFHDTVRNAKGSFSSTENLNELIVFLDENRKEGLTMSIHLLIYEYISQGKEIPGDFISIQENNNGTKTLSFKMI